MKATELQLGNINKRKKKKMTKLIAKNLMVGDYVLYPATNIIFKVQTISGGEQDTLHYVTAKNRIGDFLSRSEWEGVPLTHEILEKNFRKDIETNSYYLNHHIIKIFYDDFLECWKILYNDLIELRYVHELQHALKLCKIDKTIEL